MAKYDKKAALKIMISAAKDYEEKLNDRVSEGEGYKDGDCRISRYEFFAYDRSKIKTVGTTVLFCLLRVKAI